MGLPSPILSSVGKTEVLRSPSAVTCGEAVRELVRHAARVSLPVCVCVCVCVGVCVCDVFCGVVLELSDVECESKMIVMIS